MSWALNHGVIVHTSENKDVIVAVLNTSRIVRKRRFIQGRFDRRHEQTRYKITVAVLTADTSSYSKKGQMGRKNTFSFWYLENLTE